MATLRGSLDSSHSPVVRIAVSASSRPSESPRRATRSGKFPDYRGRATFVTPGTSEGTWSSESGLRSEGHVEETGRKSGGRDGGGGGGWGGHRERARGQGGGGA